MTGQPVFIEIYLEYGIYSMNILNKVNSMRIFKYVAVVAFSLFAMSTAWGQTETQANEDELGPEQEYATVCTCIGLIDFIYQDMGEVSGTGSSPFLARSRALGQCQEKMKAYYYDPRGYIGAASVENCDDPFIVDK